MIRCDDARLLMLAHGALEGREAASARVHAALCPACRARLRRFEALSASLAGAYRNPRLGVRPFGRTRLRWASAALMTALLLGGGGLVASRLASGATPAAARACASAAVRACSVAARPKVAPATNFCPFRRDR